MQPHRSGLKRPLLFQGASAAMIAVCNEGREGSEHPERYRVKRVLSITSSRSSSAASLVRTVAREAYAACDRFIHDSRNR